jgi:hypothetical protein
LPFKYDQNYVKIVEYHCVSCEILSDRNTGQKTRFEDDGRRRRLKKKTGQKKKFREQWIEPVTYSTEAHAQAHATYTTNRTTHTHLQFEDFDCI